MVYIGSLGYGTVYALNAGNGAQIWNYTADSAVYSSIAVQDGIIYFGCYNGKIFALNADTSIQIWNYTTNNAVDSSPAIVEGIVYIGSNDGKVYSLNATNGARIWNYTTNNAVGSSPAVVNGVVYVSSMDGQVYALGVSTSFPSQSPNSIGFFYQTLLVSFIACIIIGLLVYFKKRKHQTIPSSATPNNN